MNATYRNTGGTYDLENYVTPAHVRTAETITTPGEIVRIDRMNDAGTVVAQEWYSIRRGVRSIDPIMAFVP